MERVLKALAKKAADLEKERKISEANQRAIRKTNRKAYLKRKKAAEEKAAKEKALRGEWTWRNKNVNIKKTTLVSEETTNMWNYSRIS